MPAVWILGAGFSRPLGGPLLDDLVSEARYRRVVSAYQPSMVFRESAKEMLRIYASAAPGEWKNPEEFLSVVDDAVTETDNIRRQVFREMIVGNRSATWLAIADDSGFQRLRETSRLFVAAVCSEFVPEAVDLDERELWLPYKRWATQLGPLDTVITFNYDDVVERALEGRERVFRPEDQKCPEGPVLKPHGSVDWFGSAGTGQLRQALKVFDGSQQGPMIATPGLSKRQSARADFARIWKQARVTLRQAEHIVILGYGCPDSDSESRDLIFGSLAENAQGPTIRIVLGPQMSDAVHRMRHLAQWALVGQGALTEEEASVIKGRLAAGGSKSALQRQYDDWASTKAVVVVERLFAQDFMTVFEPQHLDFWGRFRASRSL